MRGFFQRTIVITLVLFVTSTLTGCMDKTFKGIIAAKNEENHRFLVIGKVKMEALKDKEVDEIIDIAQNQNGIWFGVSESDYEHLSVWDEVQITYPQNPDILTSDPPIIGAKTIEKVDE